MIRSWPAPPAIPPNRKERAMLLLAVFVAFAIAVFAGFVHYLRD
jgi:hypothetical protein